MALVESVFEEGRFMWASRSPVDGDKNTGAVCYGLEPTCHVLETNVGLQSCSSEFSWEIILLQQLHSNPSSTYWLLLTKARYFFRLIPNHCESNDVSMPSRFIFLFMATHLLG